MTVWTRLRSWLCGLSGHDDLVLMEADRIALQCQSCQRQTPGWIMEKGHR